MNRPASPRASWRPIAPLALALAAFGCQEVTPAATARRVATRTELIGGPSALGEVGDYLLENDHLRVIVQDKGFSRGFGVYGGSLNGAFRGLDAHRIRESAEDFGHLLGCRFGNPDLVGNTPKVRFFEH